MAEPDKPIRLALSKEARISGDTLKLLKSAMVDLEALQGNATPDTRKYNLIAGIEFRGVEKVSQLIDVLKAANHLDIELVAQAAAWRLAKAVKNERVGVKELGDHLSGESLEMVAKHYTIANRLQMPEFGFVLNISLDDVLEYNTRVIRPIYRIVDLDNRHITDLRGIEKLAEQYPDFAYLELGHNRLTSLPEEIGQLKFLRHLSLVHNQLGSLPAEMRQLVNLRRLFLTGNRLGETYKPTPAALSPRGLVMQAVMYFTGEWTPRLSDIFKDMGQLRELDLSYNGLSQEVIDDVKNNLPRTRVVNTRPPVHPA